MFLERHCGKNKRVKSSLARGRIAVLSPFAAANGFVRSWSHLSSLCSHESAPPLNGLTISSVVFAQHTHVTNTQTDTQTTLCATSVAIGRICAMYVMRSKKLSEQNSLNEEVWIAVTSFTLGSDRWTLTYLTLNGLSMVTMILVNPSQYRYAAV